MNKDRRIGQRAGIRWAIAWLHKQANEMNDPKAKAIINTAAYQMSVDAKALQIVGYPEAEGWQDIATAPKDGTFILAWVCTRSSIRRGVPRIVWWDDFVDGNTWMGSHGVVDADAVKLWQPIFAPDTDAKED